MQLLKNGTADIIASIFFKPQITPTLWRNCQLRGAVQKNFRFQKKIMLVGRRGQAWKLICPGSIYTLCRSVDVKY